LNSPWGQATTITWVPYLQQMLLFFLFLFNLQNLIYSTLTFISGTSKEHHDELELRDHVISKLTRSKNRKKGSVSPFDSHRPACYLVHPTRCHTSALLHVKDYFWTYLVTISCALMVSLLCYGLLQTGQIPIFSSLWKGPWQSTN
jgi:hypothetical protein